MTKDYGKIELKNYQIGPLLDLLNVSLPNQVARARNRMLIFFDKNMKEVEDERMALLKKYGKLDENEKLVIGADGHYELTDKEAFDKEYGELVQSPAIFDILPSNKMDIEVVRDILLTLETKLSVQQTTVYNELCEIFEKI